MSDSAASSTIESAPPRRVNVAARLSAMTTRMPEAIAVVESLAGRRAPRQYRSFTFRQLDEDSNRIASALADWGVRSGARIALLVRPGMDFIALVFALFKSGAVAILIDPGMGRRHLVRCLAEVEPEGFIAIPLAQAVRSVLKGRFPKARFNVTVGKRWFCGGLSLDELRTRGSADPFCRDTSADDPAAIIFTSGSTGPPKGVLYRHGNFDRQVTELGEVYRVRPGEIDVAAFPLFGLFNCALGVTTIVPHMDPSRPARVDPRNIIDPICDWKATQAFGSPAVWNRVGRYCGKHNVRLPTLRRVLSAGAPVPPHVLVHMTACIARDGEVYTPYGATESLPIASISSSEVLSDTRYRSTLGSGTCVGRKFPGIEWKVIQIDDGPIRSMEQAIELRDGEIGELVVSGPVVTREYVTRREWNALAKIADGERLWHRMGDVGYLDHQGRFWFCGRMSHRVQTERGPMFSVCCEAIFDDHPDVYRSALVGVGPAGRQTPVIVAEPWPGRWPRGAGRRKLIEQLAERARANPLTESIRDFLLHRSLPVDVRHNSKICREQLSAWAARKLR